jgi:DNA mismatch endonuclease (patch repair protein)
METKLRACLSDGQFQNVSSVRAKIMRAVRGRGNRTTEKRLRAALVRAGVRGWIMQADLPGRPDFLFPSAGVAVFVDGCFWHGCPKCGHVPKTRQLFWQAKIDRNRSRDRSTVYALQALNLRVIRLWEHELQNDLPGCVSQVRTAMEPARRN